MSGATAKFVCLTPVFGLSCWHFIKLWALHFLPLLESWVAVSSLRADASVRFGMGGWLTVVFDDKSSWVTIEN